MPRNKIADHSNDRQYFTITPHLVWTLCQDPYEVSLWYTIRMITIDGQTCRLTTQALAELAMMSLDKVHNCRKRLIDIGLLIGEIRQTNMQTPQPMPMQYTNRNKHMQTNPDALALQIATLRTMYAKLCQENRDLESEIERLIAQRDRLIAQSCNRRQNFMIWPTKPIAGASWN